MDGYGVAVIGYGMAGSVFHAPFVHATEGLRLAAVVTGDAGRSAAAAERYPGTAVVASVDELWRLSGIDLVVVASPNRFHVEQATAALARGKAVVVDKPVAGTGAEARVMAEAAERAGRMLTVFQNRRWDGDFRTVRDLVGSGRLGRVDWFESRFERSSRGVRTAWKASPDPADLADIRYDLGSHVVDQALVLFGPPTRVYADARDPRDATVQLTHACGTRSLLRMSATTVPVAPRFVVAGPDAGFRCWGLDPQEKASAAGRPPTEPGFGAYPPAQWGELVTADGVVTVPTQDGDYLAYYRAVAACLRGEGPPPVPFAESVALADTLDAVFRSAAENAVVAL